MNITQTPKISYIKTDNNKIINERCIVWVKKMDECMEICTKQNGCIDYIDTHRVCKMYSSSSYDKLNNWFSL